MSELKVCENYLRALRIIHEKCFNDTRRRLQGEEYSQRQPQNLRCLQHSKVCPLSSFTRTQPIRQVINELSNITRT